MDVGRVRAEARQRCHHDAMLNVDSTDTEGLEKRRNGRGHSGLIVLLFEHLRADVQFYN
jgi:hypothetical protein